MKQIQITQYGEAQVLTPMEVAIPEPQTGEVLVKVSAAGVNYSDILRRRNTYFMPTPLPYVLGSEAVGTIVKQGEGVADQPFAIGSKVLAMLPSGGGYSEYVCAPAQYCVPLPPNVDDKQATAIFVQGSTAHLLMHQVAPSVSGKTILVHAAAGGVGSLLVQLGKLAGAKVIAASSSPEKLEVAKSLGADLGIDYTQPNWTQTLVEMNGGEQVEVIFEMVGGKIFEECIEALKPGGSIIVYGAASGEKGNIHSERWVDANQQLLSFNLAHYFQHHLDLWQASLGAMIELLASQQLNLEISHKYPLTQAMQAHQDIEDRKTTGKVVLVNQ